MAAAEIKAAAAAAGTGFGTTRTRRLGCINLRLLAKPVNLLGVLVLRSVGRWAHGTGGSHQHSKEDGGKEGPSATRTRTWEIHQQAGQDANAGTANQLVWPTTLGAPANNAHKPAAACGPGSLTAPLAAWAGWLGKLPTLCRPLTALKVNSGRTPCLPVILARMTGMRDSGLIFGTALVAMTWRQVAGGRQRAQQGEAGRGF